MACEVNEWNLSANNKFLIYSESLFFLFIFIPFLTSLVLGQEKKLVEEVFNNAIDCLSDEDKTLPQVRTSSLFTLFHGCLDFPLKLIRPNGRPVSSVGRVPDYRAGGRGFKPRPDHLSGTLNN